MKRAILLALGLCLGACSGEGPAESGEVASGLPPARFRGDVSVLVVMSSNIEHDCRKAGLKHIEGAKVNACSIIGGGRDRIIIRNPCLEAGRPSKNFCHEVGHINGWPIDHGK